MVTEEMNSFVADFREAGFGVIRGALSPEQVSELATHLCSALGSLDTGSSRSCAQLERTLPRIIDQGDDFLDLAIDDRLLELLFHIFGCIPTLVCSYGHEKPRETAAHTGVHSDIGHLPGHTKGVRTVLVKTMYALTDVGKESGGISVIPKSHRFWKTSDCKKDRLEPIRLNRGDLLIFDADILHTSTSNKSSSDRLSLWFAYALPWMRSFAGHEVSHSVLDRVSSRLDGAPWLATALGFGDPYADSSGGMGGGQLQEEVHVLR